MGSKTFEVVHKKKNLENHCNQVIFKGQFDSFIEASGCLESHYIHSFSFSRKGTEARFKRMRLFIEDIEYYKPSVEVIGADKAQILMFFTDISAYGIISDSVPKLIQKVLNSNK